MTPRPESRPTYTALQRGDGSLVGLFDERHVALRVARELLLTETSLLMQTIDDEQQLIRQELVTLRQGARARMNR